MDSMTEAREIDRALNVARDPETMRALITRRRLLRAGLEFERVVEEIRADAPVGPIEPACKTIEEWRALGRL